MTKKNQKKRIQPAGRAGNKAKVTGNTSRRALPVLLTPDQKEALTVYEAKVQQLRAYVAAVCIGRQTGLIVTGEGGIGKSFHVLKELGHCAVPFRHHQGRVTARGLYDQLGVNPDQVHLIEDAESLFDDKNFTGLMRNALHSQSEERHPIRVLTWVIANGRNAPAPDPVQFRGGIIIVGNVRMNNASADFRALETRCPCIEIEATDTEILAMMMKICEAGYNDGELSPTECLEVAEYIRRKAAETEAKLNLRHLTAGFRFYIQQKEGAHKGVSWQTLLEGQLKKRVSPTVHRKANAIVEEALIAGEIDAMRISYTEKLKIFQQRSGRFGNRDTIKMAFSRAVRRSMDRNGGSR